MSTKAPALTFAVVATVDDPLSADRLAEVLQSLELDAFVRPQGGASAGALSAISQGYWQVLVQSDGFAKAEAAVKAELEEIAKDADANAKAAEEEAMSGETPTEG